MSTPIRLLLAYDHAFVRAAIGVWLSKEADVGSSARPARARRRSTSPSLRPDLIVLDAEMPGVQVIDAARPSDR